MSYEIKGNHIQRVLKNWSDVFLPAPCIDRTRVIKPQICVFTFISFITAVRAVTCEVKGNIG